MGFAARFTRGKLDSIRISEHSRSPVVVHPKQPEPTPEEVDALEARREESLIGRTMYAYTKGWVGLERTLTIVAESKTQWCGLDEHGRFHVYERRQRDHSLHDVPQPQQGETTDADRVDS